MLTDAEQLERRGVIMRLLRAGQVRRQEDLVRLLKKAGHEVTQAATCATSACSRRVAATCCRRRR